jgi:thiol-disulfide isomerase/thioredoxin
LPALRFATPSGAELDLARLRGRLLVLNFWATWCAPCVAELPSLGRLQEQLGPAASVVAVSMDESAHDVRGFLAEHAPGIAVALDPGGRQARELAGVAALPVTYVVGSDGIVREAHLGARAWDRPETLRRLRALSTSPSTAPTR